MERQALIAYLDEVLEPARYRDYCPNGLQVEGKAEVKRVIAGVTASQRLIDEAIARKADAILVHHGWFWRGEDGRVTSMRKTRLKSVLAHDINVIAYHLPLDAHAEFGNNAQLARRMAWTVEGRFGEQDLGFLGRVPQTTKVGELAEALTGVLRRAPLIIGEACRRIERLAWCSGGAQSYFEQAIALGAQAFVTGEASEQSVHLARESGVAFIAAGHHATERYGVEALAAHLAERFGLACEFVDIDNPV